MAKEMVKIPDGQVLHVGGHKYVGEAPKAVLDMIAKGEAEAKARQKKMSDNPSAPKPKPKTKA
jgi:hypothetical protein